MATINIHGRQTGSGGRAPNDLTSLFDSLLRNPNPVTEREFENAWRAKFPNADLLIPRGRASLTRQLSALGRSAERGNITPAAHRRMVDDLKRAEQSMKAFSRLTGAPLGGGVRSLYASARGGVGALGSVEASERVAAVARLGSIAAGSLAHGGSRDELRKIESTLERIEKTSRAQLKAAEGSGPSGAKAKAGHERVLQAIEQARSRINAASIVAPPAGRSGGLRGVLGMGKSILNNPYVAAALAGLMLPEMGNKGVQWALGGSQLYLSQRTELAQLGRFGGLNSGKLFGLLNPSGKLSPHFMRAAGINSNEAAKLLGTYGAPLHSRWQAARVLEGISYAYRKPGMALSHGVSASLLSQAALLGIAGPTASRSYMRGLAPLYGTLGALGIGQGATTGMWSGALGLLAGSGAAAINMAGARSTIERLAGSGFPGLRTPQGVLRTLGAEQGAISGIGKNPASTISLIRGLQMQGGLPTNDKMLSGIIGPHQVAALRKTKAGRAMLDMLYQQARHGNYATTEQLLKPLLRGNPGEMTRLIYAGTQGLPEAYRAIAVANMTGESTAAVFAQLYGGKPSGRVGSRSAANMFSKGLATPVAAMHEALSTSEQSFAKFGERIQDSVPALTKLNHLYGQAAHDLDNVTSSLQKFNHALAFPDWMVRHPVSP